MPPLGYRVRVRRDSDDGERYELQPESPRPTMQVYQRRRAEWAADLAARREDLRDALVQKTVNRIDLLQSHKTVSPLLDSILCKAEDLPFRNAMGDAKPPTPPLLEDVDAHEAAAGSVRVGRVHIDDLTPDEIANDVAVRRWRELGLHPAPDASEALLRLCGPDLPAVEARLPPATPSSAGSSSGSGSESDSDDEEDFTADGQQPTQETVDEVRRRERARRRRRRRDERRRRREAARRRADDEERARAKEPRIKVKPFRLGPRDRVGELGDRVDRLEQRVANVTRRMRASHERVRKQVQRAVAASELRYLASPVAEPRPRRRRASGGGVSDVRQPRRRKPPTKVSKLPPMSISVTVERHKAATIGFASALA